MITIRKSEERGHANHGWLNSYHTFSFANYYDPRHLGFRSLRVINEDRVAPGKGFGAHGHSDMEILSYVIDGELSHRDNMGHQQALGPNEIQRMSAGTGIEHSEFNTSKDRPVHFFQIWIEPASKGTPSSYEQIRFEPADKRGRLKLLAGPEGGDRAATINQDAYVYVSELASGEKLLHPLRPGRHAWVQVVRGEVAVNGKPMNGGDAAALTQEPEVRIEASGPSAEVLLFDLA
jgi:redox-sensitive bicupin YhaK (pirin superfamily)